MAKYIYIYIYILSLFLLFFISSHKIDKISEMLQSQFISCKEYDKYVFIIKNYDKCFHYDLFIITFF